MKEFVTCARACAALESLELGVANHAFVQSENYQGILFLKRLRKLKDRMLQKAEVAAYFGRFDEAEKVCNALRLISRLAHCAVLFRYIMIWTDPVWLWSCVCG